MLKVLPFTVQQNDKCVTWYKATIFDIQTQQKYLRTHGGSPPSRVISPNDRKTPGAWNRGVQVAERCSMANED